MQLTVLSTEPVVAGSLGKIPRTTSMIYIPYVVGCGSFNFFIPARCLDLNFLVEGNPPQFELAPMPWIMILPVGQLVEPEGITSAVICGPISLNP